jgi:hypothetical protein
MPPIINNPAHLGTTQGASATFINLNAHNTHVATAVLQWKVTVTTAQNNGGTLKSTTGWITTPIANCVVNNLPANGGWYWGQIVYEKTSEAGGGTWVSSSNKFRSNP